MGVAGLFGFLRRRYPEIVEACAQQPHEVAEGETACDNFYIDLNHIIHACTHPSWREVGHESEEEMFMEVDLYLDRLVGLMRPTRLLLVAMDGVAPTAKMAQQRGRRFYAAHLEAERADIERQVRREMEAEMGGAGDVIPPLPTFDGNVITPGTAFMARLSAHLRAFFQQKLACDPEWQHLLIIFSDSSEPGEGEHKICRFIRQQRAAPGYPPNTRHCIYGQDADLILLGLLSHEPHFRILREAGTLEALLEGARDNEGEEGGAGAAWSLVGQQPLELLSLSTLRDFLRCEFADFLADGSQAQQEKQAQQAQQEKQAQQAQQQPEPGSDDGGGSGEGEAAAGASGGSSGGGSPQADAAAAAASAATQGEVDPITGERRRVHPKAAKRRAARAARETACDGGGAAAAPAAPGNSSSAGGGGSGGGGGRTYDFERILDDVVFCTFLAGNDFLPHLPSLDYYDRPLSALEQLLAKYKELLAGTSGGRRGYLTSGGRPDAERLCWLLQRLGADEEATFQQREVRKVREQRRKLAQEAAASGGEGGRGGGGPAAASWMGDGWVSLGALAPGESLEEALAGMGAGGGNPDAPTAALLSGDLLALRRELLRRVRARMDDRAQAGMQADPVRLAMPGYRSRYYCKLFGAEEGSGPDLERLVRRVCSAFCRTLCWNAAYYSRGSPPVPPPGWEAGEDAEAGAGAGGSRGGGGGKAGAAAGEAPYASWRCHYEYHYAPLASDLARYGREALKGAAAAAWRPHPPIQPFAQLMSVLPFSSMPACLPPLVARAAADEGEGLAALHGREGEGGDVFPEPQAVGALVDLSGKKWAHTAVVRLPFPDVDLISRFVEEQLAQSDAEEEEGGGGGGVRLSDEERRRNAFRPALLLLSADRHPLAPRLLAQGSGSAAEWAAPDVAAAAAAAAEGAAGAAADAASVLSLLLPHPAAGSEGAAAGQQQAQAEEEQEMGQRQQRGVLCLVLDLAGQDTPASSPGLLPGTEEGERAISLQKYNKRRADQQRQQVERARMGRGRGRDGGGRGGRGRGSTALYGLPLQRRPPPQWQQQQQQAGPLSDEELARQLQAQFDAEAQGARAGSAFAGGAGSSSDWWAPVPPPPGFTGSSGSGGDWSTPVPPPASAAASWSAPVPPPPGFAARRSSSGSRAYWPAADAFVTGWPAEPAAAAWMEDAAPAAAAGSAEPPPMAGQLEGEQNEALEDLMPWLATPALAPASPAGLEAAAAADASTPAATVPAKAAAVEGAAAAVDGPAAAAAAAAAAEVAAAPGREEDGDGDEIADMLALLGVS